MELIPLFPLSIVVFPGQRVPLHIFEARYKEMIADCEAPADGESSPFGISLATNEGRKMESIGCTVVVEGIGPKYPDGSFDIVGQGRRRYLTRETYGDRAYATARVEYFDDVEEEEDSALVNALGERLSQLEKLVSGSVDPGGSEGQPAVPDANATGREKASFAIAARTIPEAGKRQQLLVMTSENARLQFLVDHLDAMLPALRDRIEEQQRAKSNGKPRQR
jgi:ATP-dependent Lon protease